MEKSQITHFVATLGNKTIIAKIDTLCTMCKDVSFGDFSRCQRIYNRRLEHKNMN